MRTHVAEPRTNPETFALPVTTTRHAEGSVLIEFGDTQGDLYGTVENKVPPFFARRRSGLDYRGVRHAARLPIAVGAAKQARANKVAARLKFKRLMAVRCVAPWT